MRYVIGTRIHHFADRLLDALAAKKTPATIALDPVYAHLPESLRQGSATPDDELSAVTLFSRRVIELIAPIVPVVKINSAYFERYHAEGVRAFDDLVRFAQDRGLLVIADVKRGDVGHTAEMYADAHLPGPDAITVSGYFGFDGVEPFIKLAAERGKGLFVLVRTSNPSAAAIQDAPLADGRKFHELVAGQVASWSADTRTVGLRGYSLVGAVAATRRPADAAQLRADMPRSILLVPGYGAQGGKAEDFRAYFKADGSGALIAAGRCVIFAYEQPRFCQSTSWEAAVQAACIAFVQDVSRLTQGI